MFAYHFFQWSTYDPVANKAKDAGDDVDIQLKKNSANNAKFPER